MKTIIGRIRTAAAFAVLIALAAGGAGASVTADAVWEGGFTDGSTKTGASGITYTLNLRGNISDTTGATLPITAATGAQIALSASSANLAVLVKYSALASAPNQKYELAAIRVKGKGWPGLRIATAGAYNLTGFFENSAEQTYNLSATPKLSSSGGYFLLCHQGGSKTGGYAGPALTQLLGGESTGLKWSDATTLDTIVLGGPSQATGVVTPAYNGLVIEKVAIFNRAVTGADLATYAFPTEDPTTTYDYVATITSNTSFGDITTWTKGAGTPGTEAKVYIISQNNAVLSIDGTLDVGTLLVDGGSIAPADGASISSTEISGAPITMASGRTVAISDSVLNSAISMPGGTVNFTDCEINGAITTVKNGGATLNFTDCNVNGGLDAAQNGNTAINTRGTVVFSSEADNYFRYSTVFCVKNGTTTFGSTREKSLWCTVQVEKNATLVNERQDSFNYEADVNWPIRAHIYGTLTLNKKWTVAGCNYIHLYNDATINGSAANALHFNIINSEGKIIAETGTSAITAPIAKGNGTISVQTKEGAILEISSSTALAKSGPGTLRIKNTDLTSDISGSEGVLELYNNSGSNKTHYNTISFSGTLKVTRENSSNSHNVFGKGTEDTATTGQDLVLTGMPKLEVAGSYAYLCLNAQLANQNLSVKNLTYEGDSSDAKVDPVYNDGTSSGNMSQIKTIKTKQTEDTICNLIFNGESNGGKRQSALYVYGDAGAVHSLTLTKESVTFGPLTVENYGKVVFGSSGKWKNGRVTVGNNGVLESQNSAAVAATLAVQEGATLKFANGVPLAATAYDWSGVSNDQSVNVDLSGIAPSATPVTLIASGVTPAASKFTVTASQTPATLSVEDGALKATFANIWRDGAWSSSVSSDGDATLFLSQSSTLTVSEALSLGAVTVVKEGSDDIVLTVSGSGTLSTGGWTIPAGVTVNTADGMEISGDVSGGGVINVPANTTLTMGDVTTPGDTLADRVKVTVSGTLKTKGTTELSGDNTSESGSLIQVLSGTTTCSFGTSALKGNLTIDTDAELHLSGTGEYLWNTIPTSATLTIDVSGTLNVGNGTLVVYSGTTINLREGARIEGNNGFPANANGALLWFHDAPLYAYGNAEISAIINTQSGTSPTFNVADNVTLTISQSFLAQSGYSYCGGSLTKAGAGTLCLKNIGMTKPISGSEGTVQLLSDASGAKNHTATSSFSGKVIITRNTGGGHHEIGTSTADDSNSGVSFLSGSPELEINGTAAYLCLNRSFAGKYMMVKNLTATSGTIDAKYNTGGTSKTIQCLQTEDTTYAGNFNGASTSARYVDLTVYGQNEAVKTLTLSGASGSMNSYGTLTIRDYGKVKFSGSGDWADGTVVVGANGYLESQSGATKHATTLTLQDGATVSFASGYTLNVGTTLNLPSGEDETVTFNVGFTPAVDGTTLVSCSAITAETDVSMIECVGAVVKAEAGAIKAYPVATISIGDVEMACASLDAAVLTAAMSFPPHGQTEYSYITIYKSGTITNYLVDGLKIKKASLEIVVTINGSTAEYTVTQSEADADGIITCSQTPTATEYIWTDADSTDHNWTTIGNWSFGNGTTATRYPGAVDTVIIGDGANITGVSSPTSVAAMQVSGAVTISGGGSLTSASAITLDANDSITITGTLSPTPTTAVADSYVKESGDTTKRYEVDAYNTVTFEGANMTATRTDELESAIKDGDTITFTVAPDSGYAVTGVTATTGTVTESNGVYSYTVTQDATITVTTVSTAVTFSEVEFDYYVGYGSAKSVTAKVTGQVVEGTAWTLTVGETEYAGGVYDSATGKVTWTPENGIANLAAGQALSYSIAATGGSMGTLADQQTTVGNVVDGWIAEDATHSATGTWSPSAPAFGDADSAALSGETTFTANSQASGKVTLTTVVKFGNEADSTIEIGADAKAAIKVENNSFKIWTKTTAEGGTGATADWLTVSGATPKLEADSMVVFTFDTDAKTFTVSVDGNALYYGASNTNTSFAFASDGVAISSVAYKGAGSFTSLTGEYTTTDIAQTVDGKGVVVANSFISGNAALREMTIEEAALALAPDSSATCSNGYNYFTNYALGLEPTEEEDKPEVRVTTDANGKFVITLTDKDGNVLDVADNVAVTLSVKTGTNPEAVTGDGSEGEIVAGEGTGEDQSFVIDPTKVESVKYYKVQINIGAK